MDLFSGQHLNKPQLIQKYPFLNEHILKNWLFKNTGGFRQKVVRKIGRRIFFNENALLAFLDEHRG